MTGEPGGRPAAPGRALTPDEVGRVLRRAAELDAAVQPATDLLDAAAVEEAAVEAGLSRAAVRQALDELALAPGGPRHAVLGPSRLSLTRRIPGAAAEVTTELHGYLHGQLLEAQRVAGSRSRWVPRRGPAIAVRRAADLDRRLRLLDVDHVDLVVEAEGDVVLVTIEVGLASVRRAQVVRLAGGATAGAAGAGVALAVVGMGPAAVVALPVGAGLLAGGHAAGRSHYRQRANRVHAALAGVLDRLEHPGAVALPPRRVLPLPGRPRR